MMHAWSTTLSSTSLATSEETRIQVREGEPEKERERGRQLQRVEEKGKKGRERQRERAVQFAVAFSHALTPLPALLSLQTLFLREHNLLVDQFRRQNSSWDNETLFQEARRWVVAFIQSITENEVDVHPRSARARTHSVRACPLTVSLSTSLSRLETRCPPTLGTTLSLTQA